MTGATFPHQPEDREISFMLSDCSKTILEESSACLRSDGFRFSAIRSEVDEGWSGQGWLWDGINAQYNGISGKFFAKGLFWPSDPEYGLDFFAVHPGSIPLLIYEGRPCIYFGPGFYDTYGSSDIMTANAFGIYRETYPEAVPLHFIHPTACIAGVRLKLDRNPGAGVEYRVTAVEADLPCDTRYFPETYSRESSWSNCSGWVHRKLYGNESGLLIPDFGSVSDIIGEELAVLPQGDSAPGGTGFRIRVALSWVLLVKGVVRESGRSEAEVGLEAGTKSILTVVVSPDRNMSVSIIPDDWIEMEGIYESL